ncbi:OsmC family protein [Marinimicrobium sp. ABcell2]|uniref:OsmC family protein n=1 Tax=Marinimicrobium sp. ABcell2 TaxID=3069751 RepID=UPI0027B34800|nr:OsmC family protein [Marinimicrobium sp. ABcell2]MDQ2076465.1 OsmC family protein [Marinimicrobium sp. ABcell2]
MQRNASAHWEGGVKGHGEISTASGALDSRQYSFDTRFQDAQGTNPEELIGAAHAGCFSMALAKILDEDGHHADRIDTKAGVELEKTGDGFGVTRIHLNCTAEVPGLDNVRFEDAATKAKENCPISQLLKADISLEARLVG